MSAQDEAPGLGRLLTRTEVAVMFRVEPQTVSLWVKNKRLTAVRTPGGAPRYCESEVRALLAGGLR